MDDNEDDNRNGELEQHDDGSVHRPGGTGRPHLQAHPVLHELDVLLVLQAAVHEEREAYQNTHQPGISKSQRSEKGTASREFAKWRQVCTTAWHHGNRIINGESRGRGRDARLLSVQILSFSCIFRQTICKIMSWYNSIGSWRPPLEILDPLLILPCFSYQLCLRN